MLTVSQETISQLVVRTFNVSFSAIVKIHFPAAGMQTLQLEAYLNNILDPQTHSYSSYTLREAAHPTADLHPHLLLLLMPGP